MANGNRSFNLRDCERFFAPLAATIQQFAARRNLAIARYDHESPSWDLNFAHPIGGFGRLSLAKSADTLQLSAVVWIDQYDLFVRRLRQLPASDVSADEGVLARALDSTLDEVLSWPLDDRFESHTGYDALWKSMSRHEFMASQPLFPTPLRRVDG
jgi:hypothetical protein